MSLPAYLLFAGAGALWAYGAADAYRLDEFHSEYLEHHPSDLPHADAPG